MADEKPGRTPRHYKSRRAYASLTDFFQQTGIRQRDIAEDAGITETHLSNIIAGKRTPSLKIAIELCRLTNVPVEAMLRHTAA